ncbi:MAG: hypothetical protein JW828_05520 [Sedimentisphaerales bacterium]|nr:hypothetical protein [Sedimentisphaerales bacterium]
MATITFDCPGCGGICGFDNKHAGRLARCTRCQQRFIVPQFNGQPAQKIKPDEDQGEAIGGFYHALFIDNIASFFRISSSTPMIWMAVLAIVRFAVRHRNYSLSVYVQATGKTATLPLPFGLALALFLTGCMLRYYMELARSAAFEEDVMPDTEFHSPVRFTASTFGALYSFFVMGALACVPMLAVYLVLRTLGLWSDVESDQVSRIGWSGLGIAAVPGLFLFPMLFLVAAVMEDLTMLFDVRSLFRPIRKAFGPYLLLMWTVAPVVVVHGWAFGFGWDRRIEPDILVFRAVVAILLSVWTLATARGVGLFYRHYGCYMT